MDSISLSKTVLESLPRPARGEQSYEYRSIKNPRLRAIVSNSRILLAVRMNWKGKRYYKSFGTFPEMKIATFTRLADQFIVDVQSGDYQKGSHLTVGEFIGTYFSPYSKKHHRDHRTVLSRSKKVLSAFGEQRISAITRRELQDFLNSLDDCSNATINRYRSLLSKIFSMAVELEIIEKNPCKGIKKLPENNIRDRVLSLSEINAFCRLALLDTNFLHAYALLLSLMTGMRIGNVISIKRSMLAVDLSSVLLPMTKSGKAQRVYLSHLTQQLIRKCLQVSFNDYLFPSLVKDGQHISYPRACMKRIQAGMQRDGCLEGAFNIHDLRRTYASFMLMATSDIRLAQQSLGHSNVTVTERYAHHQQHHLINASQQTVEAMLPDFSLNKEGQVYAEECINC